MKDCPLCGWWDCECEDILSPSEYKELVEREILQNKDVQNAIQKLIGKGVTIEMIEQYYGKFGKR